MRGEFVRRGASAGRAVTRPDGKPVLHLCCWRGRGWVQCRGRFGCRRIALRAWWDGNFRRRLGRGRRRPGHDGRRYGRGRRRFSGSRFRIACRITDRLRRARRLRSCVGARVPYENRRLPGGRFDSVAVGERRCAGDPRDTYAGQGPRNQCGPTKSTPWRVHGANGCTPVFEHSKELLDRRLPGRRHIATGPFDRSFCTVLRPNSLGAADESGGGNGRG